MLYPNTKENKIYSKDKIEPQDNDKSIIYYTV